jgi:UDP:flavonoid glycosyltransferase YjiC (YdhE family)
VRVALVPFPILGHLVPVYAIAEALAERGHQVFIFALRDDFDAVRAAGAAPIEAPAEVFRGVFNTTSEAAKIPLMENGVRTVSPALLRAFRDLGVDLVVVDVAYYPGALAAERSGLPWASLAISPFTLSEALHRSPSVRDFDTDALRAELGLPPTARDRLDQSVSPHLHLLAWPAEFDVAQAPQQSRHVGPLHWSAPERAPAWLDELRADRPTVLVTTTSAHFEHADDLFHDYVDRSIEALNDLPVNGIVTVLKGESWPRVRPRDHVRVVRFASHQACLERSAVAVTHGGWGIITRAMTLGVPLAIVPCLYDQPTNAAMCERRGVALTFDARALRTDALRDGVTALLDPAAPQRQRMQELAASFPSGRPAGRAADHIEHLALNLAD